MLTYNPMNSDRISKNINRITNYISSYNDSILTEFPIDKYLTYLARYPETIDLSYISPQIDSYCNNIVKASNNQTLELYHQLLLLTSISKAEDRLESEELPTDVKALYRSNFARIITDIESNNTECYTYSHSRFRKDLPTCTMRMIPVGARKIHMSRIPRVLLFTGGIKQLITASMLVGFTLRGFSPFYAMHSDLDDPDLMAEFNPAGFKRTLIRIAKIIEKDKRVKGVFGYSWFYDPQLANVSPNLAYLRNEFTDHGGESFRIGPSAQAIKDAIQKSPTRRKLHKEGKYVPTDYVVIWPRNRLIEWANRLSNEKLDYL